MWLLASWSSMLVKWKNLIIFCIFAFFATQFAKWHNTVVSVSRWWSISIDFDETSNERSFTRKQCLLLLLFNFSAFYNTELIFFCVKCWWFFLIEFSEDLEPKTFLTNNCFKVIKTASKQIIYLVSLSYITNGRLFTVSSLTLTTLVLYMSSLKIDTSETVDASSRIWCAFWKPPKIIFTKLWILSNYLIDLKQSHTFVRL